MKHVIIYRRKMDTIKMLKNIFLISGYITKRFTFCSRGIKSGSAETK